MVKKSLKLPDGWFVIKKRRRTGWSRGKLQKHYHGPNDEHFKSLNAVFRFLNDQLKKSQVIVIDSSSSEDEESVIEKSSDNGIWL